MAYAELRINRVVETFAIDDNKDRICWESIIAGIFVAIAINPFTAR